MMLRDVWRYVSVGSGVLCVMIIGVTLMQPLSASNLDSKETVC